MQYMTDAPHLSDELLSERLDDHLATAEQQRVDEHLATCAACAARYAGLRATQSAMHSLRAVTLPRDFRLDVAAPVPSSPRQLMPARNVGIARLLSAAALICGLLFLVVGLFTFTLVDNPAAHQAATSNAAAAVPLAPTSCVVSTRCPSVNAGTGSAPTTTSAYGSGKQTPQTGPTSSTGGSFGVADSSTGVAPNHNTTPALLIMGFGILTAVAGAIGLWRLGRPHPPTPSTF